MRQGDDNRPSPEQVLQRTVADERRRGRGRLKIYLGYASGVGKSFRMLDEGRRRHERGQDVVVGAVQSQPPVAVRHLLSELEIVPPRCVGGGEALDIEALKRRHPAVCLVDGLAWDNPPGTEHPARWQDVEDLLDAGITVIGTVNIQHIEELRAQVEEIAGPQARETVPRAFVTNADGIVVVDVPADDLLTRARAERLPDAGGPTRAQLSRLREIALLLAAEVVDRQLEDYLESQGLRAAWGTQERILVCVTPRANAAAMIAAARRTAERFHGELVVLYVRQPNLSTADQAALDSHLALARAASATIEVAEGEPVSTILAAARRHGITQIFIGHSLRGNWRDSWFGGPVDRLIAAAQGMDVWVFPHQL